MKRLLSLVIVVSILFSVFACNNVFAEKEIVAGDTNNDGYVNSMDVINLKRAISDKRTSELNIDLCDVNCDTLINSLDVILIKRFIVGGYNVELYVPSQKEEQYRDEVFRLVNEERKKEGIEPLAYYLEGQDAADIRAEEIKILFDHTRPDDRPCYTVLDDCNIQYWSFGENIAWGYSTPKQVVEAWMNSEGHRENILSDHFDYIIIGVKGTHWVQLFLSF